MSNILIFIIIILIICLIVGFKIKEGFTCLSAQIPVFDMKLYAYNCMSSLTSGFPKCNPGQTVIINAPTNAYKCGTIYGDPISNFCSINTNDPTNYLITCDGYKETSTSNLVNTDYESDDDDEFIIETHPIVRTNVEILPLPIIPLSTTIPPIDYSPFVYPTFAPPQCNVISKLIITPANTNVNKNEDSIDSKSNSLQTNTPNTRMDNYNKSEQGISKPYIYESVPFPYLPAFNTF